MVIMVMTGSMALRRACSSTTPAGPLPLALAVSIYSSCMVSSREVRVICATCPAEFQPRAMAGRMKLFQLSAPERGSQRSRKANTYCSSMATMNTGREIPSREKPMNSRSAK